jgi:TRAP-type uncharacterized transport system fused permease subunit
VYVTSGLAGSRVWATGWEAVRLGIAAFLIPFAFVLNNGLLLKGGLGDIVVAIVTATVGAVLIAAGIRGYAFDHLNVFQKILVLAGGLLMIAPGVFMPVIGLAVALLTLGTPFMKRLFGSKETGLREG